MKNKTVFECLNLNDFRRRIEEKTNNAPQKDTEERAGFDFGELSKIYNGRKLLSIDHLIKLSHICGCSTDYLLFGSREDAAPARPAAPPSYPDLIRCVDALVTNGLAEIVDYKTGETMLQQTASGEWEEVERIKRALAFNDAQLSLALCEYREIITMVSLLRDKFKNLWLKEEQEKDFLLTKEGMNDMLNNF